jgi:preprotein translocase subunit YajC
VIELLADATTQASQSSDFLHSPLGVPMLLMVAVIWVMMFILPRRKQDRNRQQMLKEMARGSEVQTIGVIIGKVVETREDRVLVKVDESSNTKIWFSRTAISKVVAEDSKDTKASSTK